MQRKIAAMSEAGRCPVNPLIVALVFDGLSAFEYTCAAEIFSGPRTGLPEVRYRFETAGMRARQRVATRLGMQVVPMYGLSRLAQAGTVIVTGWKEDPTTPVPESLATALREAHARNVRIVSICTGAFVLAAAGLLDGRRATTHWRYAEALQAMYPRIEVDPGVLYVDEGSVLTSAGSASAIDLCLHLVRKDYGARVANQIARRLVVQPYRDGGQAQFIERPVSRHESSRIAVAMETMQRRLGDDLSIPDMARMAAMSERTFMRHFKDATGTTPGDWLRVARIDRARQMLESSATPIELIALECGFGTAATMRQQFRKKIGISPKDYKRRFSRRLAI